MRNLFRILAYYKGLRWRLLAVFLVGSMSIVAFAFMPVFLNDAFNELKDWIGGENEVMFTIIKYLLIFGILAVFNAGFDLFCSFTILKYENRIVNAKIVEVKKKLDVVPTSFLEKFTMGDLSRRVAHMTGDMVLELLNTIYTIARVSVFFITTSIMMFMISWILAIVVVLSIPVCIIIIRVISKITQKNFNNFAKSSLETSTYVDQKFAFREFYKLHGIENEKGFKEMNREHTKATTAENGSLAFNAVFIAFFQNFMQLVVTFLFCILFVTRNVTDFGVLPAFIMFSSRFLSNAVIISNATNLLQRISSRAPRVFEILDCPDDVTKKESIDIQKINREITFKNVSLIHKEEKLLDNVSFNITQGQSVAFVGQAGSGKTYLVDLLAKLAIPTKGQITVDGVSLDEITSKSYYKCVGVSLEKPFIFRGSVAENLLYGVRRELPENVMAVTEKLGSHEFIEALPNGYETWLSDNADVIGNGEKQAIGLARLVLQNPDVAIFHQSLSSADTMTERNVYEKIMNHKKTQTTIFVTHRLSSVEKCDIIFYMERGKIVEKGTHRELMAKKKRYYNAYMGG